MEERKAKAATIRKNRWNKKIYKNYSLRINKQKEPKVIEKLSNVESINGYIVNLIKEDLEK